MEPFLLLFFIHLLSKYISVHISGIHNLQSFLFFVLLVLSFFISHCFHIPGFILFTECAQITPLHEICECFCLLIIFILILLHFLEKLLTAHFSFLLLSLLLHGVLPVLHFNLPCRINFKSFLSIQLLLVAASFQSKVFSSITFLLILNFKSSQSLLFVLLLLRFGLVSFFF